MRYTPKTWEPSEVLTQEGLNQLTYNVDYIQRMSPTAKYSERGGAGRREGVKIASGKILIAANQKNEASGTAHFNTFFSPCKPNIAVSLNTRVNQPFLTITGKSGLEPDQTGFVATIQRAEGKNINSRSIIHWIAVGI